MQNKCFNCLWFITCKRDDKTPEKENCEFFDPKSYADEIIKEIEGEIRYG